MMTSSPTESRRFMAGDVLFLAAVLVLFAVLTVGAYYHLGEDAFISFRYARNLAQGHGLVYNHGEFVEGYSNLAWVLLVAPFELVGVRIHLGARVLSAAFHAGLIALAWWVALGMRGRVPRAVAWWLPLAVALEPLLHFHNGQALETVAHAALLGGALLLVGAGSSLWLAGAAAGIAVLTRPEGIGFALALVPAVYTAALDRGMDRKKALRPVFVYTAVPVALFAGQLVFRKWYHGSLVPNTMVAKQAGGSGLDEVLALTASHALLPLLGAAGCLVALMDRRLRTLAVACLGMMFAAVVFQIKAGALLNTGFRYMAPLLPAAVIGTWLLVLRLSEVLEADRHRPGAIVSLGVGVILLVPVVWLIHVPGHRYLRGNTDAPRSRLHVRMMEARTWNLPDRMRWYLMDPIYINSEVGRWTRANLPADALLAGDQMGQFGYFAGEHQSIVDLLGLMDWHIARNGLSLEYLEQRAPAYLVVETCLDTPYWPRDWRLKPHVPWLRALFDTEQFGGMYRPRWLLHSNLSFMQIGYCVYIRRDLDDGSGMEHVPVGVTEETFEWAWGIL